MFFVPGAFLFGLLVELVLVDGNTLYFATLNRPVQISIPEDAPVGTTIYTVVAFDVDSSLVYGKTNQTPALPDFQLNTITGDLLVPSGVDAEKATAFKFIFDVSNGHSRVVSSELTLQIRDVNEHSPVFNTNHRDTFTIPCTAEKGDVVIKMNATDADVSSHLTYLLTDNKGNTSSAFEISNDGVIQVKDIATNISKIFNLTVIAFDGSWKTSFNLTIKISDVINSAMNYSITTSQNPTSIYVTVITYNMSTAVPDDRKEESDGVVPIVVCLATVFAVGFITTVIVAVYVRMRRRAKNDTRTNATVSFNLEKTHLNIPEMEPLK